jgi:PKD domain-containing protein
VRPSRLLKIVLCLVSFGVAHPASAASLHVCASGCQYTKLQAAIDAAAPGDTILLRAGETFVGPFILRAKASSTAWITIRSDAADSQLPAAGVRLIPSGKPNANTSRSLLPRLLGQGGALKTTPVIRTDAGAHHYVLKFLEVDGSANLGYETLIALGTDTTATPAHDLVVDRVYAHGHQYKGMKRGIALNGKSTDVLNSYISDIKAVNADAQGINGYNGAGPFRIINNYVEGAGENLLFGGSDPAISQLVPTNLEIRGNHFFKPLTWKNAILATPGSPKVTSTTASGSLAAGTHYFKVVALMYTDTRTAVSAPSAEVSGTSSSGKGITLSWSAVAGADRYRIYRGTSAGGESRYLETTSATTTFTYTGASEISGTPASSGTKWTVKNIFELKNAEHVTITGNIIENVWAAGQYGYAIVLTPRNQNGTAPWVRLRDITLSNNIVRHASGVVQLAGYDVNSPTLQTQGVTIRNNLFYDIDPSKWGGSAKAFLIGDAPANVTIDRNTIIGTNSSVVYAYGSQTIPGFVYTNNISKHGTYGIMGENGRPGQYSIDKYFPSSNITYNVLAGGTASNYPKPNAFPTLTQWSASFPGGDDYRILTTSVFYSAGIGGSVPGANIGTVSAAVAGVETGTSTSTSTPPPPPPTSNTAPVARPGGPYTASVGGTMTADGSASSDADGTITSYRWSWGDEVVVDAADIPAANIVGSRWVREQDSGASQGIALHNPDLGEAKKTSAAAAPSSYVTVRFYAAAGVPYHLWFRMRAQGDSYSNDSMFVQFDGSVDANRVAVNRIGSSNAAAVVLEEGTGAGVSGWGWNDDGYGTLGGTVYFATSGLQTMRIQQREDGIMWDQFVLSSHRYLSKRPGSTKADNVIVADPDSTSMVSTHSYAVAGQYPLALTVIDNAGAAASATTTVTVK